MRECQTLGRVADFEAYRTWNMGQGLLVVTKEPDRVIARAEASGFEARRAGRIVPTPTIKIRSKGTEAKPGSEWLSFPIS